MAILEQGFRPHRARPGIRCQVIQQALVPAAADVSLRLTGSPAVVEWFINLCLPLKVVDAYANSLVIKKPAETAPVPIKSRITLHPVPCGDF